MHLLVLTQCHKLHDITVTPVKNALKQLPLRDIYQKGSLKYEYKNSSC
jgi:hypothetical protein